MSPFDVTVRTWPLLMAHLLALLYKAAPCFDKELWPPVNNQGASQALSTVVHSRLNPAYNSMSDHRAEYSPLLRSWHKHSPWLHLDIIGYSLSNRGI